MPRLPLLLAALLAATPALAAKVTIPIDLVDGTKAGTLTAEDTKGGLKVTPKLSGLPAGPHGFHVHENPSCQAKEQDGKTVPALAAGGHYDPMGTKMHKGPWGEGHAGDMPALAVNGDGRTTDAVVVPRLKVKDLKGRSVVIHAGMDNYSDEPKPLGGGGPRIACGVVP